MPAGPPDDPPPAADPVTALVAAQLGMALPAECVAGVGANLTILAGHWAALRTAITTDMPRE